MFWFLYLPGNFVHQVCSMLMEKLWGISAACSDKQLSEKYTAAPSVAPSKESGGGTCREGPIPSAFFCTMLLDLWTSPFHPVNFVHQSSTWFASSGIHIVHVTFVSVSLEDLQKLSILDEKGDLAIFVDEGTYRKTKLTAGTNLTPRLTSRFGPKICCERHEISTVIHSGFPWHVQQGPVVQSPIRPIQY